MWCACDILRILDVWHLYHAGGKFGRRDWTSTYVLHRCIDYIWLASVTYVLHQCIQGRVYHQCIQGRRFIQQCIGILQSPRRPRPARPIMILFMIMIMILIMVTLQLRIASSALRRPRHRSGSAVGPRGRGLLHRKPIGVHICLSASSNILRSSSSCCSSNPTSRQELLLWLPPRKCIPYHAQPARAAWSWGPRPTPARNRPFSRVSIPSRTATACPPESVHAGRSLQVGPTPRRSAGTTCTGPAESQRSETMSRNPLSMKLRHSWRYAPLCNPERPAACPAAAVPQVVAQAHYQDRAIARIANPPLEHDVHTSLGIHAALGDHVRTALHHGFSRWR